MSGEARKGCKEEVPDDLMTLEDFLARAGAVEEDDIKDMPLAMPPPETERLSGGVFSFDPMPQLSPFSSIDKVEGSIIGFGNGVEMVGSGGVGRGKRGRAVLEPMDKVAQQRQRRMIKNRESAARSRERKQVCKWGKWLNCGVCDYIYIYFYTYFVFCCLWVFWILGLPSGVGIIGGQIRGGERAAFEREGN